MHFLLCNHFKLTTDQRSVAFIFGNQQKGKVKNDKIERRMLELSPFKFDIVYRPGKENRAADTLSPCPRCLLQTVAFWKMKRKRLQSDSSPHLNSSGALRFKISLTKGEIEADSHEDKAMEPATSSNLLKVLLEVHRQFVKRDSKGIFANPVTLDIAPDYFSVISSPMDLGTMHSKLLSRRCYATAGQYLSDLRLMCTNAMRYNPPETVYYQKARKLLAFGEKLLSSMALQRICTDLGLPEGLTVAEMGDLEHRPKTHRHWTPTASASSVASPHHFTPPPQFCETTRLSSRKARPPDRRPSDCAPSPPSLIPARLSPEFPRSPPALELRQSPPSLKRSSFSASSTGGGYDASDVNSSKPSTPRSVSGAEPQQPLSPQLSSQQQQPAGSSVLRASSSRGALFEQDSELIESSLSPAPSTPQSASPISDYASACASQRQSGRSSARSSRLPAPASAPVLLTSGRRQSRPPVRLESARPVTGSDTPRMIGRKSTTRKPLDITPKKVLRKGSGRRKSHIRSISKSARCHSPTPTSPQQSSTVPSPAPKSSPFRMYAEDAWSFSDSMTDLTPPDQILAQVREAARRAREEVIARYCPAASVKPEDGESADTCQTSLQKIVYLDVSQPGRISAVPCPLAETRNPDQSPASSLEAPISDTKPLPVCYPPALVQLLTGRGPSLYDQPAVSEASEENSSTRPSLAKSTYHGLIEQMTSQEVNTLHALSKLRYKEDEPIAANIHGPLGIFDTSELAEMFDVYGGDPVTVEYVLSLLTFVESVGPWARREITKKLDVATSGLHSQMLASFLAAKKTSAEPTNWMSTAGLTIDPPKPVTPPAPKMTCSNDNETPTTQPVPASCSPDSQAASTAVIQPLSSTHTILHTRQTATVLPLQRSGQADTSQGDNHHSVSVPETASTQSDAGPGISSVQLVESKSPTTCSSNAVTADPVQGSSAPQSTTSLLMPSAVCTMTSQEVNTLHALSKLRYKEDEPIAANIHGPLGIFDTSELAEMFDVYGGDPVTVEYVLSLLTFVESVGPWARREITKKLDVATSGLHSQMLASFLAAKKTSAESTNWMSTAGLTIDPPKPVTPPAPKMTCINDNETPTTQPVAVSCPPDSKAASTAVIQPLSNTHTVLHTRQTATVLPLQRSGQADSSQGDNHHSVAVPETASTQSDAGPGISSVQLVESKSPTTCSSNAVTADPVQDSSAPQSTTSLLMPSAVCTVSVSAPSTVLVVNCPSQAGHESDAECTGRPPTLPSVTSADAQHESSDRTGPFLVSCSDNEKDAVAETPQTKRCCSSAPADSFTTNPADDHPSQPESLLLCPTSPCPRVDHTEQLQTHTVHPATDCQEVAVTSDQPLVLERCLQPVGTEEGPTKGNEQTAEKGKSLAVQGQDALLNNSNVNQSAVVLPRPASAQNFTIIGEPEGEDQGNGLSGNRERSVSAPPSLIGEVDKQYFVPVLTDPN
nr:unnamed protein product [Spirometra erinaceieuropaei]